MGSPDVNNNKDVILLQIQLTLNASIHGKSAGWQLAIKFSPLVKPARQRASSKITGKNNSLVTSLDRKP